MFNTYRYRYDEINFYFIFDKDKPDTDDNRSLVLLVDKEGTYYLANASNSGDFTGSKKFSFEQICNYQPKIKDLKSLFKPLPLTPKEKEIYNKIKEELEVDNLLEFFGSYDMVEAYISYGHILTDNQYSNLTDDLKSKYVNLSQGLTDYQLGVTPNKLKERYDDLHSLGKWLDNKYSKEEQTKFKHLNCTGCHITSLKGIEKLTNLIELDCSENNLTSLKGIEKSTFLIHLYCSDNKLTSLKGIENLTNLKSLNCRSNNLTSLQGIENLTNLTTLYCLRNPVEFDSDEILRKIKNGESIE
jgi:Leucine-rich repeat (LRR) protein